MHLLEELFMTGNIFWGVWTDAYPQNYFSNLVIWQHAVKMADIADENKCYYLSPDEAITFYLNVFHNYLYFSYY